MIYLKYFVKLIFENIGKSITLTITIVSFILAGTFSDDIRERIIVASSAIVPGVTKGSDTTYAYLYKDNTSIVCVSFDHKLKPINGVIKYSEYNGLNVLFWAIFAICSVILTVGSFTSDSDINWEFRDKWSDSLYESIISLEEDNKYYWVLNGRLLSSNTNYSDIHSGDLRSLVDEYIRNKNRFPKFYTRSEKRNNKLDKIGI